MPGLRVKQVSAGGMHSCVLTDTGEVRPCRHLLEVCTQSPQVTLTLTYLQQPDTALRGLQVWTWGEPWGDFSMKVDRSPKSVAGATDIVKIACGAFHNLCLNA